jgi:hypothetical protein
MTTSTLPHNWANWEARETCRQGGGRFVSWAEPAPTDPSEDRYAVAQDSNGGVRWWRFSPNPDVTPQQSSGCFYGDKAEENAAEASMQHKAKMARWRR